MKLPMILALAALIGAGPALADPPRHAPAHGYYKDKKKQHKGKSKKPTRHPHRYTSVDGNIRSSPYHTPDAGDCHLGRKVLVKGEGMEIIEAMASGEGQA